ncbi:MAG TPA: MBOAT family protein [Lachnospiraceae bacterium]|nr:MBOAT family protein [Lachnospiraceae bacterium]
MAYHTSLYLFMFLPAALLAYQLTPKKLRWITLVLAGYAFFWTVSGVLVLCLAGTTVFAYAVGLRMGKLKQESKERRAAVSGKEQTAVKKQYRKREKRVLLAGIAVLLSVLGYLKYYNFFAANLNFLLERAGGVPLLRPQNLLLPVGISFYTLQAIGYMADVYWGKIPARGHPGKLALFLGFFPQIMEGPIAMYDQTAEQLWQGDSLRGENLSRGCVRILWGLFKKMVVADRLYVFVKAVFDQYTSYSGVVVAAAAVAYTVQLYMEFSGCMDIITGSGRMFGVALPENFRQPFAARNAAEFWRRWHITLGVWFKTYIFYPVSVSSVVKKWNRFGKKHLGGYLTKVGVSAMALFPVWLCNGLWHGPKWHYVFYGMYYFVILFGGVMLEPVRDAVIKACHVDPESFYWRALQTAKTWSIIFIGELFFRANGLRAGFSMFWSIFRGFELRSLWDGTFLDFGLDPADWLVIAAGCILVAVVGMIRERGLLGEAGMQRLWLPVRWGLYYGLIFAVMILGAYGTGYQQVDMIYAGF